MEHFDLSAENKYEVKVFYGLAQSDFTDVGLTISSDSDSYNVQSLQLTIL